MEKIFIIKETIKGEEDYNLLQEVNNFIEERGKILSVTSFWVAASSAAASAAYDDIGYHGKRFAGRILIVANDGKWEGVIKKDVEK